MPVIARTRTTRCAAALADIGMRTIPADAFTPLAVKAAATVAAAHAARLRGIPAQRLCGDPVLSTETQPIRDTSRDGIIQATAMQLPIPDEHLKINAADGRVRVQEPIPDVPMPVVINALHAALRADPATAEDGVAANELGFDVRALAVQVDGTALTMINPSFTEVSPRTYTMWDSCRTCEDIVRVCRHYSVGVSFFTPDGDNEMWFKLPQERSRMLQHKIDHLDGVMPYDRVDPLVIASAKVRDEDRKALLRVAEEIKETNPAAPLDTIGVVPRAVFDKHRDLLFRAA